MIEAFIKERGITKCPDGAARGTDYYKPTATGYGTPESFLHREPSVKCNERGLAQAKILTMIQDLGGYIKGESFARNSEQNRKRIQDEARRWFFNASHRHDFEAWCDTAGYDPQYVREQAQKVVESGIPQWRAAPGKGVRYQERKQYRDAIKLRNAEARE